MKISIIVYDRFNLASFASAYEFFHSLEGASVQVCAFKPDIMDEHGIHVLPSISAESLYGCDVLVVPSGVGALSLRHDDIFLSWLRSSSSARVKLGLDLGVLLFGGAGFLKGKSAVIRGGYKNALSEYCDVASETTFISSDDIISAVGFSAGLRELIISRLG
ncbi:hypothetical protein [Campylobacter sp. 19-13652]|uniref:hypothetical protein n=1 Tax=Campylobacter sp. 19-13652 TaxID=2840180 RepID=UPI001C74725E|nr:hypothetical protein [Campylobacter sp. 19-13652]BCX79863.1 hypothetical protein LBC_13250 [Campylobacter sp. 19-13652]